MTNQFGQDVDAMYEAYVARQWEELNASPEDDFPEWGNAIECIESALKLLSKAEDELYEAAGHVEGSPEYDRIVSLAMSVSDLYDHILDQNQRMRG